MSKVSFRARALDATKQMTIYYASDVPDLSEYASINRAVPQMPTGMEKEEEMELHLQQAISAQQAATVGATNQHSESLTIPIPQFTGDSNYYDELYGIPTVHEPASKQLIKVQAMLDFEPEIPNYDLDDDDQQWLAAKTGVDATSSSSGGTFDISPEQFERMIDCLERSSEHKVVQLNEAKTLLQEDHDITIAVYDYWLSKRLRLKHNLTPTVKTEKRDGPAGPNNPYMAFRRRGEKIQTRKNRRNDEESYEKMLRVRRDLRKAVTLLEMISRREKSKRELINLKVEIIERRTALQDWSGETYNNVRKEVRPAYHLPRNELIRHKLKPRGDSRKKKRTTAQLIAASNRDAPVSKEWLLMNAKNWHSPTVFPGSSSAQLQAEVHAQRRKREADAALDGEYAFKRRRGCAYFAPSCQQPTERSFVPTFLHPGCFPTRLAFGGLVRRRLGRAGRYIFDRSDNPLACLESSHTDASFRPVSPVRLEDMCDSTAAVPTASRFLPDVAVTNSLAHHPAHRGAAAASSRHRALVLASDGRCATIRVRPFLPLIGYGTHQAQVIDFIRAHRVTAFSRSSRVQSDDALVSLDDVAAVHATSAVMDCRLTAEYLARQMGYSSSQQLSSLSALYSSTTGHSHSSPPTDHRRKPSVVSSRQASTSNGPSKPLNFQSNVSSSAHGFAAVVSVASLLGVTSAPIVTSSNRFNTSLSHDSIHSTVIPTTVNATSRGNSRVAVLSRSSSSVPHVTVAVRQVTSPAVSLTPQTTTTATVAKYSTSSDNNRNGNTQLVDRLKRLQRVDPVVSRKVMTRNGDMSLSLSTPMSGTPNGFNDSDSAGSVRPTTGNTRTPALVQYNNRSD